MIISAISVWKKLGPSEATTAIARRGPGTARNRSVRRMRTLSTNPRVAPAMSPTAPPTTTPELMTTPQAIKLARMP